jgi:perosamine synthetase
MQRIPVSGPWISQKEVDYVADATANAWYQNANSYHQRFEKAFAEYLGVRYTMALPSCTSAIHLSLLALRVGPGDEVIVPDITWIASAAPVTYVGAMPVFADVERDTWCLSAKSFEQLITPRTKAIIPVDLYGSVPDWDAVLAVAKARNIAVIEDAAEAIGSEYHGKRAGAFGLCSVFSFHGSKTLTTGEGGLLATSSEEIFKRASFLRDHGRPPGDKLFYNTEIAYKYKMSSMQAALGLAQLERVEELVSRKREIFSWYKSELEGVPGLTLNAEPAGTRNSYWMNTVILDRSHGLDKKTLMEALSEYGVDCRPFFHPLSSLPAYESSDEAKRAAARNVVSYDLSARGINLPSGLNLSQPLVKRVCDSLKTVLENAQKVRDL